MEENSAPAILLSVIIPVYRVENYLNRCLDCLIPQLREDTEIILVDDGSPDRCPQICDAYVNIHHNIHVIHQEKKGAGAARNSGLSVAKGELIAFVDPDDWVHDRYVSAIREMYYSAGCMIAFSFETVMESDNGNQQQIQYTLPNDMSCDSADAVLILERNGVFNYVWNKVYRRALLNQEPVIRFVEKSEPKEDLLFNCAYFSREKRVVFSEQILYYYRKQLDAEKSLSHKYWPDLYKKTKLAATTRAQLYNDLGLISEPARRELSRQVVYDVFKCVPNMYRAGKKESRAKRLQTFQDMTEWKALREWIRMDQSPDWLMRQFRCLYRLCPPQIMDIIFETEFLIHYRKKKQ